MPIAADDAAVCQSGDGQALPQPLRVEDEVVLLGLNRRLECMHFPPGAGLRQLLAPAPPGDRDDPADAGVQAGNRHIGFFRHPVDLGVRVMRQNVADQRQVVHQIAHRGHLDQQDFAHEKLLCGMFDKRAIIPMRLLLPRAPAAFIVESPLSLQVWDGLRAWRLNRTNGSAAWRQSTA